MSAEPSAPLSSSNLEAIRAWAAWMPVERAAPEPTEDQWATLREMDTQGGTLSSSLLLRLLAEIDRLTKPEYLDEQWEGLQRLWVALGLQYMSSHNYVQAADKAEQMRAELDRLAAVVREGEAREGRPVAALTEIAEWVGVFNGDIPVSEVRRMQAYLNAALVMAREALAAGAEPESKRRGTVCSLTNCQQRIAEVVESGDVKCERCGWFLIPGPAR